MSKPYQPENPYHAQLLGEQEAPPDPTAIERQRILATYVKGDCPELEAVLKPGANMRTRG